MSNFSRVNFESMLEVSVNRRLTAALEEGNGKTPSWLQWEEEQTLNGIKERRKQLHTEMASIQRWVHISRKYTCGLTKIHEGSEKRCLSWEIQNSKAEDLRRKREDGLGAAHPAGFLGLSRAGMHMERTARGHPALHTHQPNNGGTQQETRDQGGCKHQHVEQLPRTRNINKSKSWSRKNSLLQAAEVWKNTADGMTARIWKEEAEARGHFSKYLRNIFGSRAGSCGRED